MGEGWSLQGELEAREKAASPAPLTPRAPGGGRAAGRLARLLLTVVATGTLIAGLGMFWFYRNLDASLPVLDGELTLPGLASPVEVQRDGSAVPTVRGRTRLDVTRALGFVHAQERFFQMDLLRRQGAGELAELLGAGLLPADRRFRVHRFRSRARQAVESFGELELAHARAYAEGVNAGLQTLRATPFEYLVLGVQPEPWRLEDTLLTGFAMYFELNDDQGRFESARGLVRDLLGSEVFDFLYPAGSSWDAPIDGQLLAPPPLPEPSMFDLRRTVSDTRVVPTGPMETAVKSLAASNNWAVSGALTAHGGAILANDMHLGHSVPNIWYRASLLYTDGSAPGGTRRVTGVTLPGTPFMIAGSNGQVAWGFTNTWGDWEDLVVLEPATDSERSYLTPEGPQRYLRYREMIPVRGAEAVPFEVLETIWGPVVDDDHRGRKRALRWIAHDQGAASLALLDLERVESVEQAVEVANRVGAPPQNLVAADREGRIAWTVMGRIPRRFGHDGRLPSSWADGTRGWDGYLDPAEYPRRLDPPGGRLWTANNRVIGGETMRQIGVGTYRLGARGRQIRDSLTALESVTEQDMLTLQLDDRALFLERWQRLLVETLEAELEVRDEPRYRELREAVAEWTGRAAVDSADYRLVRAFRLFLAEQVLGSITAACENADSRFAVDLILLREEALWRLVSERPMHLLDPRFESWDQQLLAAADQVIAYLSGSGAALAEQTWGRRNRVQSRHPLSRALPFAGRWLDMPAEPLPGDEHMPRFQAPSEGASMRLVVSPGREQEGIFHMPTGQSGHPLSPHYRDGHAAWVHGDPTPLLPGAAEHTLVLNPAS